MRTSQNQYVHYGKEVDPASVAVLTSASRMTVSPLLCVAVGFGYAIFLLSLSLSLFFCLFFGPFSFSFFLPIISHTTAKHKYWLPPLLLNHSVSRCLNRSMSRC